MEKQMEFKDGALAQDLFGPQNRNLEILAEKAGITIDQRGASVFLRSDDNDALDLAAGCLNSLYGLLRNGRRVFPQDVDLTYRILAREPGADVKKIFDESVFVVSPKKTVAPQTLSQRDYLRCLREYDLVIGIGPAGTGKTYIAVAMALACLFRKEVKRIVLTRPAVEAGEKLGFLPGDIVEKVNPYLRPLYDALHDMLDFRRVQEMIETGVIEIAPLAFMRGRTLSNSYVILDEAQNTTFEQLKMFLTRLGPGSKAVVTGDVTQIDLPPKVQSGLILAEKILYGVPGIGFARFHDEDVIRHPLVGRIVRAYERYARQRDAEKESNTGRCENGEKS